MATHYVEVQKSISDLTGNTLAGNIMRGDRLPTWAPADRLFIFNNCSGLFISTGDFYHPWMEVEFGPGLRHIMEITYHAGASASGSVPILSVGRTVVSTIWLDYDTSGHIRFRLTDPFFPSIGKWIAVEAGLPYRVTLDTDTTRSWLFTDAPSVTATMNGQQALLGIVSTREKEISEPTQLAGALGEPSSPVTVVDQPVPIPQLCRSLSRLRG